MNKPELIYIIFGCVACICNGGELRKVVSYENQICPCSGVQPAFGVILSKVIAVSEELCSERNRTS